MIRKIRPQTKPQFSCHHSLSWLAQYAQKTLIDNGVDVKHLWVVDSNEQCFDVKLPDDVTIDILLTGSFFLRMLELPFWPIKKMRLWTLSEDSRNLISEVFKISQKQIGLIPHPETPATNTNESFKDFVYAGRLSWGKNIEALLSLVSYLQNTTHPSLTLTIYGEKSDLPEESFGRVIDGNFDIQELINLYPWKSRPALKGNDPEWFDRLSSDSHYISLSTSMYEDFALSPTEAAQHGSSLILSRWGGHKHKRGAKLLNSSLIFKSFEPNWIKEIKTKLLAQELTSISSSTQGQDLPFSLSENSSQEELTKHVMNFIHKQSPEILLCFREAMDVYADTFKGRNFFYLYQKYFSSLETPSEMVFYEEEPQKLNLSDHPLFIPAGDAHLPEVMKLKMRAKALYEF